MFPLKEFSTLRLLFKLERPVGADFRKITH